MASRRCLSHTRALLSVGRSHIRINQNPKINLRLCNTRYLHRSGIQRAATGPAIALDYTHSHKRETDLVNIPNFVDNNFSVSQSQTWIDIHDPATNEIISRVPQNTDAELKAATDSAAKAFSAWRSTSLLSRQQIIFKLTHLIRSNEERLVRAITAEQGKTVADAKAELVRGIQVCEAACGITSQLLGEVLEVSKDMETRSYREPLGVVASICPFNFPAMVPLWTIPQAIVTGNCLVLKPSERDPGAAMIIAELCREAGLPDGVLNVVHGSAKTVDFLIDAPEIKAISFVGGNHAGEYIYTRASAKGKRVQANLGAKNHAALLPDCNQNHAINAIAGAAFGAAGQRCMALTTLVTVGESKEWLPKLVDRAKALVVNGGFEQDSDLGPLITPKSAERVEKLIQSAEDEGATILLDGRGQKPSKYPNGNWVCSFHPDINALLILRL